MRFLLDENVSYRVAGHLKTSDSRPSVVLIRDVQALASADLAALLRDALSSGLGELLDGGAIASLSPDQVRVRPLPLRPGVGQADTGG